MFTMVPLGMGIVIVCPSASFTFKEVSSALSFGITEAGGLAHVFSISVQSKVRYIDIPHPERLVKNAATK